MRSRIAVENAEIQMHVQRIASELVELLVTPENLVLVVVMEGASRFAADLSAALYKLGFDLPQTSIKVRSQVPGEGRSNGHPEVKTLFDQGEFAGKDAVVVEDLDETGLTLSEVEQVLLKQPGFRRVVAIACLLHKEGTREIAKSKIPTLYGVVVPAKAYVYGYGIDDEYGLGRGADDVMYLEKDAPATNDA